MKVTKHTPQIIQDGLGKLSSAKTEPRCDPLDRDVAPLPPSPRHLANKPILCVVLTKVLGKLLGKSLKLEFDCCFKNLFLQSSHQEQPKKCTNYGE